MRLNNSPIICSVIKNSMTGPALLFFIMEEVKLFCVPPEQNCAYTYYIKRRMESVS